MHQSAGGPDPAAEDGTAVERTVEDGRAEFLKRVDGTAESPETRINTITVDGTGLDIPVINAVKRIKLNQVTSQFSCFSRVHDVLTKHLKSNVALNLINIKLIAY